LETLALHESEHYSKSVRLHNTAALMVYFREAIVMPEISEYVAKFDQNALEWTKLPQEDHLGTNQRATLHHCSITLNVHQ